VPVEHRGKAPTVDPSAWVAPTALLCGAVRVGPDARVLWNAVMTAEAPRRAAWLAAHRDDRVR
jgi:carbonic anhydrase/acetyltransferase-like protein (isoleucine patch superfamily)